MAGSLLALLDDIATILDDVALLSKVAAKKTAGVLGDDLALNAQQVSGLSADRELAVVWAVAKGSLLNKAILVPAALAISAFVPAAISPLLMLGGAFLCFEGAEKLTHGFLHGTAGEQAQRERLETALTDHAVDPAAMEKERVKGAIRTDFILSAEIIAISLGVVQGSTFATQVGVLVGIAVLMTVGVYGLVGGIVKLDDAGLYLSKREGDTVAKAMQRRLGKGILAIAPWLMKALSLVGTAAMFMVGGGLLLHGITPLQHTIEALVQRLGSISWAGPVLEGLAPFVIDAAAGLLAGLLVLLGVTLGKRLLKGHAGRS
jgi:predicted DNA repair protein MutK